MCLCVCLSLYVSFLFLFFFLSWVFDVLYCSQPSRRKDTHGVFSEPVDPEEVQFSYFFFCDAAYRILESLLLSSHCLNVHLINFVCCSFRSCDGYVTICNDHSKPVMVGLDLHFHFVFYNG